jgi:hypothetical protein
VGVDEVNVGGELPSPAELGIAGMDQDALGPRLEALSVPQVGQLLPCGDQRVLQRIFGRPGFAQDAKSDGV